MPGPTKRTRSTTVTDSSDESSPPARSSQTTPTRRRPSNDTTPTRPINTRSNTTLHTPSTPSTVSPLTRSTSQATVTTRRSNPSHVFTPPSLPGPSGRGGALVRTQSQPITPSMSTMKTVASAPGGSGSSKGDPDSDLGLGPRRPGRGKENIPPKKDSEGSESSSRKRLRVGSRSDRSARARSGSISSMRSEGGMSSAAPSSSMSRRSRLPSPSPSVSSATTRSLETSSQATSADPLDVLDEDVGVMDVDKTPTKPKARAVPTLMLPTPPPSSPSVNAEVDAAAQRIGLVRVQSDASVATESTDDSESGTIRDVGPYKSLKMHLRLSESKGVIVGRQEEQKVIREYVASTYKLDVGMYVSGPPGTGKTATVTAMAAALGNEGWKPIEICCMGMKANDIWSQLANTLGCSASEAEVCAALQTTEEPFLLILDEIDSLMPPSPATASAATSHLLSKLFCLPTTTAGRVKVIAISNTLDLTLRARLALPDGATPLVLPFKAYAGMDMVDIVSARIESATIARAEEAVKVDSKALELLTKKVEAQNGDLRMCLSVLTSAVNLAEAEWNKKVMAAESQDGHAVPLIKVSLAHVIKAFTSYNLQLKAAAGSGTAATSSVTGKKVRTVPLQGKMVLCAMLIMLARVRAGLSPSVSSTSTCSAKPSETLTTASLYATYVHLLSHHNSPYPPSSESDYQDLLSNLEVLGLISIAAGSTSMVRSNSSSSGRSKGLGQKVELCGRDEDIREGLSLTECAAGKKGLAEEEIARIWDRESGRIERFKEKARLAQSDDLAVGQ